MSAEITLSAAHEAGRAAAALAATLARLNAGTTGATLALYATARPGNGADPGGSPLATFTLPKPAGTIASGLLALAPVEDALIMTTGVVLWARFAVNGAAEIDCNVSDTAGSATIQLATTQLYAGGSVRLSSGILG